MYMKGRRFALARLVDVVDGEGSTDVENGIEMVDGGV